MAIMDRIMFKQEMRLFHLVGTLGIVICTLILSLQGAFKEEETSAALTPLEQLLVEDVEEPLPAWIPVLFGVITPVFFTINGFLTKHLTEPA